MPLDDALGLIDRDFERYCQGVREGRIPPRKPPRDSKADVSSLLSKAASGEQLDAIQLQSLIDALQEKKQSTSASRPNEFGETIIIGSLRCQTLLTCAYFVVEVSSKVTALLFASLICF